MDQSEHMQKIVENSARVHAEASWRRAEEIRRRIEARETTATPPYTVEPFNLDDDQES